MLKPKIAIQDMYGHIYTNPVVLVNQISAYSTVRKTFMLNQNDLTDPERIYSENEEMQIAFNAIMYVSEEAMKSGFKPLVLRDKVGSEWFIVNSEFSVYTMSDAELLLRCENHLKDVILPSLELKNE